MRSLLLAAAAPFVWWDSVVQKGVDRATHSLMRATGWSKTSIRYGLAVAACAAVIGLMLVNLKIPPVHLIEPVMDGVFVALSIASIYFGRYLDNEYEQKAVVRKDPLPTVTAFCKVLFWEGLVQHVLEIAGALDPLPATKNLPGLVAPYLAFTTSFAVFVLLQYYTEKTPPRPPEPVTETKLVPVPVQS